MIEVSDLGVSLGGRPVLALDRFSLAAGEAALLTGPSGAGKSTFISVVAGLMKPERGRVVVDGVDLATLNEPQRDAFRARRIGIVFQSLRLVRALSVSENLALALRLAGRPADSARIYATLERVGVADKASRRPGALSVGEAQRAAIARAVVAAPRLILADEPTSALDDQSADAAMDLLFGEARACGASLLVTSHDGRIRHRFQQTHALARPA
jgi:putative ABC transport system ATP-binding protein